MKVDANLLRLRNVFASALDTFERENALSTDKHPPDCMCGPCQLVSASRDLVQSIDEMQAEAERQRS